MFIVFLDVFLQLQVTGVIENKVSQSLQNSGIICNDQHTPCLSNYLKSPWEQKLSCCLCWSISMEKGRQEDSYIHNEVLQLE